MNTYHIYCKCITSYLKTIYSYIIFKVQKIQTKNWSCHAELGGRGGSDSLCDVGVDQGAMGVRH